MGHAFRRTAPVVVAAIVLALTVSIASADGPGWKAISQDFHGLLFGLNVGQNGQLLVADSGAGPTKLDPDSGDISLIASLPNVSDVIQVGRREYMALTGGGGEEGSPPPPGSATLYRIKDGDVRAVAELGKFEADHGPDGAMYAGELTGFPATPGFSRIWRIEPDARHVTCGTDDGDCTQVEISNDCIDFGPQGCGPQQGPRTSIVDITFGKDGTAYVVELDEASWLAATEGGGVGGTVNACRSQNGGGDDNGEGHHDNGTVKWSCKEVGTGLPFPLAAAAANHSVYVTLALGPEGPVEVALLTNGGGEENGDEDHGNGDHEAHGNT